MNQARVWAIVPVKDFARAKTRLSAVLDAAERAKLARALFDHVLDVLAACSELAGVLVATDSDAVAALAKARNARIARDSGRLSLGAVVDQALNSLSSLGAASALVLMGDLPAVSTPEIRELLALHARHDFVAAPDRHLRQTNALALRLPAVAATRFGQPGSFEQHRADAVARHLSFAVQRAPGLELDLDDADDLAIWRRAQRAAPLREVTDV